MMNVKEMVEFLAEELKGTTAKEIIYCTITAIAIFIYILFIY